MPLRAKSASSILSPTTTSAEVEDPVDATTLGQAQAIVTAVATRGEEAVREHAARLGDIPSASAAIAVSVGDLKAAYDALPQETRDLLQRTAQRIRSFAQAQRDSLTTMETSIPGGKAGHRVTPVTTAGCYAPGGRYPLPSSVLMTACTARVAGVSHVVVCSPRPSPVTLAAAYVAQADVFLCIGGAQAVAAMAYGLSSSGVPACDVIVGPGNKWVTAAKQIVSGRCGIDMLAGPSECLVWADKSSDASVVAADLLAQAEHDVEAVPILVTHEGEDVVNAVQAELEKQLATLTTGKTARTSVESRGFFVSCASKEEAAKVCNALGPEHLEVMTRDWAEDAKMLTQFGGLFVGPHSAEVLGDYGAGPNHVLPTSGTARYTGGLSVMTFLRVATWMRLDAHESEEAQQLVRDAVALARIEGLEGHARAAEKRLVGVVGGGAGAQSPSKKGRSS